MASVNSTAVSPESTPITIARIRKIWFSRSRRRWPKSDSSETFIAYLRGGGQSAATPDPALRLLRKRGPRNPQCGKSVPGPTRSGPGCGYPTWHRPPSPGHPLRSPARQDRGPRPGRGTARAAVAPDPGSPKASRCRSSVVRPGASGSDDATIRTRASNCVASAAFSPCASASSR